MLSKSLTPSPSLTHLGGIHSIIGDARPARVRELEQGTGATDRARGRRRDRLEVNT